MKWLFCTPASLLNICILSLQISVFILFKSPSCQYAIDAKRRTFGFAKWCFFVFCFGAAVRTYSLSCNLSAKYLRYYAWDGIFSFLFLRHFFFFLVRHVRTSLLLRVSTRFPSFQTHRINSTRNSIRASNLLLLSTYAALFFVFFSLQNFTSIDTKMWLYAQNLHFSILPSPRSSAFFSIHLICLWVDETVESQVFLLLLLRLYNRKSNVSIRLSVL